MKIGILPIGQIDSSVIEQVKENLDNVFPNTTIALIAEAFPVPEGTLDEDRQQHRSDIILDQVRNYAHKTSGINRVLAITDIDIFLPPLSFVFGQAECPGKAALISLFRLKPEFYKQKTNVDLFIERAAKEAVHELGHTFGLQHCSNPFCVMYFSNSIFDTDRKQSLFCSKCYLKLETLMDETG
jgi:archaemetzincin